MNTYLLIGLSIACPVLLSVWLGLRGGDWQDFDEDEEDGWK